MYVKLEDIKTEWANTHYLDDYVSLEDYIRNYYRQVYDRDLNFLGWERKVKFVILDGE